LLNQNGVLLFHWGVLLELADGYARIGRRARGFQLPAQFDREDGYRRCPVTDSLLRDALGVYRGRPDKDWGLTDSLSFDRVKREAFPKPSRRTCISARPASRRCCWRPDYPASVRTSMTK
jgi:hypothetical protein